jgi:ABC-2 type transport system permease protein
VKPPADGADAWGWLSNELRFEGRRLMAPGGRRFVLAVALAMAAFCAWAGTDWRRFQRGVLDDFAAEASRLHRAYLADAAKAIAERWPSDLSSPLHPVSSYWKRVHVAEPPAPGAALAVGQSDLLPYYAVFNGVQDQVLQFAAEIQNPSHLALGRLDLAFWAAILLPMLMVALAYDLVAEERDAGRLPLLGLSGVGLRRLFLVRVLYRAGALAVLSLAGITTLLLAREPAALRPGGMPFLALAALLVGLQLLLWAALAFWVASLGRSSSFGALLLTAFWVASAFAVPGILQTGAELRHPTPSRNREAADLIRAAATADGRRAAALAALRAERPELTTPGDAARQAAVKIEWYPGFLAYQRSVSREEQALARSFRERILGQERLIDRWRFLSPSLSVSRALQSLAGSAYEDRARFVADLEAFRARRRDAYLVRLFRNEVVTPAEVEALPAFEARPARLDAIRLLADSAWLALASAVLFVTGWRRFRA